MSEIVVFQHVEMPDDFRINSWNNYKLIIGILGEAALELAEKYPKYRAFPIYRLDDD